MRNHIEPICLNIFRKLKYSPDRFTYHICGTNPYRTCMGHSEERNCNSQPHLRTMQGMKITVLDEWNQLAKEPLNCFITKMKLWWETYISVSGGGESILPITPFRLYDPIATVSYCPTPMCVKHDS